MSEELHGELSWLLVRKCEPSMNYGPIVFRAIAPCHETELFIRGLEVVYENL